MLFACGSAGITSMLPALLSVLSAPLPVQETGRSASESQPTLGWKRGRPGKAAQEDRSHTRLAAFLGTATGCGALVAVFVFLRLPTVLAPSVYADTRGATGLERTFRLVAGLAVLNACVAFAGLPYQSRASVPNRASAGRWYSLLLQEGKKLGHGFALAKGNRQVLLGYAAGFAARAQTITVACVCHCFDMSRIISALTPEPHPAPSSLSTSQPSIALMACVAHPMVPKRTSRQ